MTPQAFRLFRFLDIFWKQNGHAPSFQEMQDHLKLKSKSGVCRLVGQLKRIGYVSQQDGSRRSVEIIKYPPQYPGEKNEALDAGLKELAIVIRKVLVMDPGDNEFTDALHKHIDHQGLALHIASAISFKTVSFLDHYNRPRKQCPSSL